MSEEKKTPLNEEELKQVSGGSELIDEGLRGNFDNVPRVPECPYPQDK